jgi:GntR family transcriptional regulator of gluconate operon
MTAVQRLDVHHPDLGFSVAGALKQAIFRGELTAGTRLVETELAERFGTSRGPVRDALVELERCGLVESRPRRGTVVRTIAAQDVEEIYSLRAVLETLAVRRLLRLADGSAAEALTAAMEALDAAHASGDRVAVGEADMAYHRTIVALSGHSRLLDSWDLLADQTMLLMTELSSIAPVIQAPAGDHRAIADAIASGDEVAAVAALERHLAMAAATMGANRGTQPTIA